MNEELEDAARRLDSHSGHETIKLETEIKKLRLHLDNSEQKVASVSNELARERRRNEELHREVSKLHSELKEGKIHLEKSETE